MVDIITDPKDGQASLDDFAASVGVEGGFDQLFLDWVLANYVEGGAQGPSLILGSLPKGPIALADEVTRPGDYEGTVSQYAADYIALRPMDEPTTLTFGGAGHGLALANAAAERRLPSGGATGAMPSTRP